MGYRSEVGIALYTKDYNTMVRRAKALKDPDIYGLISYADRYIAEGGKVTILYYSWIKWYPEYKDIAWIEKFIQKVQSAFVRTGEDMADNEEICHNEGYDLLEYCCLTRIVDINGEKQPDKELDTIRKEAQL